MAVQPVAAGTTVLKRPADALPPGTMPLEKKLKTDSLQAGDYVYLQQDSVLKHGEQSFALPVAIPFRIVFVKDEQPPVVHLLSDTKDIMDRWFSFYDSESQAVLRRAFFETGFVLERTDIRCRCSVDEYTQCLAKLRDANQAISSSLRFADTGSSVRVDHGLVQEDGQGQLCKTELSSVS